MLISYSIPKVEELRTQFDQAESLFLRLKKRVINHILRKRFTRYSLLAINSIVLLVIVIFISRSSPALTSSTVSVNSNAVLSNTSTTTTDPLDQLSSADIAVNLAHMTNLAETTAVVNQADSVSTELSLPATQAAIISKPQAVQTDLKSRKDIASYTTQAGDTVASIAAKFGVTSESIMWSNNISGNTVDAGTKLSIPPVNGIVYTVQSGDTPDTLAQKYRADSNQIIAYNDAEINGLKPGEQIIIPNGQQPAPPAPVIPTYSFYNSLVAVYGYNGYDFGFCTWYVANQRNKMSDPLPSNLGNASTWDYRAAAEGLIVNKTPAVGAAVVTSHSGAGHVAFVERVNSDGSVWVSEMNSYGLSSMSSNSSPAGGFDRVDYKLLPASAADSYNYIH